VDERTTLMRERTDAVARAAEFERRLDALAERIDRGLILTDAKRERVLWVNERAAQLTGRSVDTLLANPRNILDAIHPEERARVDAEVVKQGAAGGALDYRVQRGGGTVILHEERVPVKDARGQTSGVLSILSDQTKTKQMDDEFEAVQRRLGVPLEDAPLVFYALRPSGNYGMTFVSPNVEKVLGHRVGDFLADPVFWTAQLHPDEQSHVFAEFPTLFQRGSLRHTYRFKHADGSYRILEDAMNLIRNADGQPLEIVGYWIDVTERVRLQEGVDYSLNRIKELQDSRTRLLNTISHDLANPITPIRLQIALLQPVLKTTPQARNIEILSRNVETLNRLIQDLKDVARLEAGKLKVDPVPGEIMSTVQAAMDSFQGTAIEKGIVLEAKLGKPVTLPFDEQRVTQVLFNFLSNALKFTPQGGQITLHALPEKESVVVRVTDSGRGLTEDEIDRLFKPFSQVHDRSEIKEKGTGLGLYICKGLIESHGGRVFVESPGRGKGSTFGFELPIAGGSAPSSGDADQGPEEPQEDVADRPATSRATRAKSAKATTKPRSKGSKISGQ
jgi:PAS domain S-box-containing protein